MSGDRYRVVQWATGNIGLRSLRAVIEHPELDLVGLYVYSEGKDGQDAGELCGLAPIGVRATRDVDEIVALQPDCVLYMGDRADMDVLCRLLESGSNVVSTRSEFHHPEGMDPDVRERLEAACTKGNARRSTAPGRAPASSRRRCRWCSCRCSAGSTISPLRSSPTCRRATRPR